MQNKTSRRYNRRVTKPFTEDDLLCVLWQVKYYHEVEDKLLEMVYPSLYKEVSNNLAELDYEFSKNLCPEEIISYAYLEARDSVRKIVVSRGNIRLVFFSAFSKAIKEAIRNECIDIKKNSEIILLPNDKLGAMEAKKMSPAETEIAELAKLFPDGTGIAQCVMVHGKEFPVLNRMLRQSPCFASMFRGQKERKEEMGEYGRSI